MFLNRTYDPTTMTYSFVDGSSTVPEEMRQDMILASYMQTGAGGNGIFVLATLFSWKERLGIK